MSNLYDYLDWRGDLSLAASPFNEVDNLVLAWFSYTDFDGVVPERGSISLREARDRYFSLHTEEELRARKTFYRTAPFLLKQMAETVRFRDMTLGWYINEVEEEADKQVSALTFGFPDGSCYVAFRGTDNTLVGWKEDCQLAFLETTAGQERAAAYLTEVIRALPEDAFLRVGGHSKGGNLAIYAAAFCDPKVRDRISEVWSNDGPGFLPQVTETEGYQKIRPKIRSIIPACSVVGLILENPVEHAVVESDARFLLQHDATTWQVLGDHLIRAEEQETASLFMDRTVEEWLKRLTLPERQVFFDALFALPEEAGGDTLEELSEHKMKTLRAISQAMRELPEGVRKAFIQTLWELVKTGSRTGAELFTENRESLWERIQEAGNVK